MLVTYWLNAATRSSPARLEATDSSSIAKVRMGRPIFMTADSTTAAQFPKAPGTYVVPTSRGAPGQVDLILHTNDSSIWVVAEPGTFTITTFDGSKFAGTFQMKVAEQGPDLKATGKTATVSGTFDLACSANPANVCK
jgi:hypothetical protein